VDGPPGYVINTPQFSATLSNCQETFPPTAPAPPICSHPCPGGQVGPDGFCRDTSPKNGGGPPPDCCSGNPVNTGTGNKFQAESDLAARGPGSLSLVRYYNSGRPAYDRALGGYWLHTYTSRIAVNGAAKATYYRNDGKQLVFNLQSGVWTGDADVAGSGGVAASGTRAERNCRCEESATRQPRPRLLRLRLAMTIRVAR